MGMGLTMGMGAALFLAIWVVMMIAMMFPVFPSIDDRVGLIAKVNRPSTMPPGEGQ
jgi:predicted metal-binding membrane protein